MRVPVEWAKEYVDLNGIGERELIDKLVLTGSNNEGSAPVCKDLKNVVVGKILEIKVHPNADKLSICQVDVGSEVLQIVTGATNINEGDYIPVALHGAVIADDIRIKRGKLRGEVSNGMLCSLQEMGFDDSNVPKEFANGIFILQEAFPLGQDILEALNLQDTVIDFEITPNRPDCLSMIGMAREMSATFERNMTMPAIYEDETGDEVHKYASVRIEDETLCPRYVARVIENIKIEPSPLWMQMRLMQAGMRPINNIVDITNYVMLEYGQPIHAFDLDSVDEGKIVVRRARAGEPMVSLDDKTRELNDDMLVIADEKKAIGIAGVMGGANTEITPETKRALIEVANFDKSSIRKTSKELGLRSEASSRFEKGVSRYFQRDVVNRVCYLIESIGAGKTIPGVIDVCPVPYETVRIPYDVEHISAVIGTELSEDDVADYLNRLEIQTVNENGPVAVVPHYRLDLGKEIDLVEEVARLYGYDRIGMTLPKLDTWGALTNAQIIEENTKMELLASGVNEILTYSFVSRKDLDRLGLADDSLLRSQVELINPLGEEYSVMRSSLIPGVLDVLARNYNRKIQEARIFELGSIFLPKALPITELPIEKRMLVVGMYGEHEDFFTLKGVVENLMEGLGISDYYYEKEGKHPVFHSGRCANIIWGTHILGTIGELHPTVQENFDLGVRTYVAELDFNILLQLAKEDKRFKPIPRFPAIERDMAILVKDEVTSMQIEKIIQSKGGALLESVALFDMYKGKQIPAGYKSLAYALVFRAEDRTLVDEDINELFTEILSTLESDLGAQLR